MAQSLGTQLALLVRNHGIVTCGTDVEQATLVAMFLDRAAKVQVYAASFGAGCTPARQEEMASRAAMLHSRAFIEQSFAAYARETCPPSKLDSSGGPSQSVSNPSGPDRMCATNGTPK